MRALIYLFVLCVMAGEAFASPTRTAEALLTTLTEAQRGEVAKAYDDPDRTAYRLTPGQRGGVMLKDMTEDQRDATFGLLEAVLNRAGMAVVRTIIDREARLGVIEKRPDYRHPDKYYIALFGTPGGSPWALRFEGHHLSLNVTFNGDDPMSLTPVLLGANPRDLPDGVADPLRPFLDAYDDAERFLAELAKLFRTPNAAGLLDGAQLDASGFGAWGHPHLEVSGPTDFGRQ